MNKKQNISLRLFIYPFAILLLSSLMSAKISDGFKKEKKHIESLTIISSLVKVESITDNSKKRDRALINSNRILINRVTKRLLSSKYKIEQYPLPDIELSNCQEIYQQLDKAPKKLKGVSAEKFLKPFKNKFAHRFALLISYGSTYNPRYEPHYNLKRGMGTNSILFNKNTKPMSDLRVIMIDTETKQVVFYDKISSTNYDPRVESEIEAISKKILRKIYYK